MSQDSSYPNGPFTNLREAALAYHEYPAPGKLTVMASKQLTNQRDLALAYSPGVAYACEEIVADPLSAFRFTSRGNLVGVITNGTAVLGLGPIGPLAAKPVMEGKAVLFKKFAGIDVFDIEINERDPDKLIEIIASLEPTFGGINLEDVKAPECFHIERSLRARMGIPVFHDDQHGTAIIVAAALLNALDIVGKNIESIKLVVSGAGAAALGCVELLLALGFRKHQIWLTDVAGVVHEGRKEHADSEKMRFAQTTDKRSLAEVIEDADVFLGLSAGGVLKREMVAKMAANPIIFALANPEPEISPEDAKAVRVDAIIATGRSDYPNQVNNVLCFPFLFRGVLDAGATTITREMEIAAARAIARIARLEQNEDVVAAYGMERLAFGPEYLIPKPFDPRLLVEIAPAVVEAAHASGVATKPLIDLKTYRGQLQAFVHHSGAIMKPIYEAARTLSASRSRIIFAEGEDVRVLRAAQILIDENIAFPVLVGRPKVILERISRLSLRFKPGQHCAIVNPENDDRYGEYWQTYYNLMSRQGVTRQYAKLEMRRRTTLIATMLLHKGEGDGMICGTISTTARHLRYVDQVIGRNSGALVYAAMSVLLMPGRQLFLVDTHVNLDPTAEELAQITVIAAKNVRRFGPEPKVALLSYSNFGSHEGASPQKMRMVLQLIREYALDLQVDGEMHGDCALDENIRNRTLAESTLFGDANLLVMPNLDAANIAYNLLKTAAGHNVAVGPILLGCAAPVHILTPAATVRGIINMTALTVVEANLRKKGG